MRVEPRKTRIFREGQDLIAFIEAHVPKLKDGSVLAVTSKIVALAEGRTVSKGKGFDKKKLVRAESEWAIESYPKWWLTVRDGAFLVNAGIDESNAAGKIVLLPKDSFAAAAKVRAALLKRYKIKRLGVIITDSHVAPLRNGVFGIALGYAGIKGIRDYRGTKDLFGRSLAVTQVNVPDALASAAALSMGEGAERQPLAIIEDAPVEFRDRTNKRELLIAPSKDIYRRVLRLPRKKIGKRAR
ncbi:MAG: coenzyme F420-0:L-glutamate ligase [Candidatus Kaiserbacteria bacterium]|nr:MAG: coenzyme F420-0:L-glutamate ligase [Candidatus Kaiserbacteria bacterium]